MAQQRPHECAVPNCGKKISRRRLMCAEHLAHVPEALIDRIERVAQSVVALGPRPAHITAEDSLERAETMQKFVDLRNEAIALATAGRAKP